MRMYFAITVGGQIQPDRIGVVTYFKKFFGASAWAHDRQGKRYH